VEGLSFHIIVPVSIPPKIRGKKQNKTKTKTDGLSVTPPAYAACCQCHKADISPFIADSSDSWNEKHPNTHFALKEKVP